PAQVSPRGVSVAPPPPAVWPPAPPIPPGDEPPPAPPLASSPPAPLVGQTRLTSQLSPGPHPETSATSAPAQRTAQAREKCRMFMVSSLRVLGHPRQLAASGHHQSRIPSRSVCQWRSRSDANTDSPHRG